MVCIATAAMQLADEHSRTGFGRRILQWARAIAEPGRRFDLPVFLKFGGIDAELLWMRTRIRTGVYRFSLGEFDGFARESVSRYGGFLDALTEIIDRRLLRICAAYPAVHDDAHWADDFLGVHRPADRDDLARGLAKTEIPDRSTRTQLRRIYNEYLKYMCRTKSLAFVDDFSPFIDPNGDTDELCYVPHAGRDFHVSYAASEERMVKIISAAID
jgi:hypothetical protein